MSMNIGSYAQALYDLAREQNLEEAMLQQAEMLSGIFTSEPDYLRLLSSHSLSKQERCQILDEGFRGKIEPYLLNFMRILTEKGYIRQFPQCVKAFRSLYNDAHGILSVQAVTALPLTQQQSEKLQKKLSQITGKQIQLVNRVDENCMGGVRLSYDGKCIDGTVKNRLDDMRNLLKNTVL